jgi:hypothetical protein
MKNWPRADKIAFYSFVATVIGILVSGLMALLIPELRLAFGLDFENSSQGVATSVSKKNSKSKNEPDLASNTEDDNYRILPASLVRTTPHFEYMVTVPESGWIDTRILIKRNQEIWIEYVEGSSYDSWVIQTNTDSCSEFRGCGVDNRWDEHGSPVNSNRILGDEMSQDTLKIATYFSDNPITVNITVIDKDSSNEEAAQAIPLTN